MPHDLTIHLPPAPRFAILTEGSLGVLESKTAVCVLRFRPDDVVALVDSTHAGGTAHSACGVGGDIPIVSHVQEAAARGANTLLLGIAPRGGGLPEEWRAVLHDALDCGLHIVSGLHVFVSEDEALREHAARAARELVDLRRVPHEAILPAETPGPRAGRVVLTVGSDCAVGKLTASMVLADALTRIGRTSVVGATGQTGVLLCGWGVAVDRAIADFAAGITEAIVDEGLRRASCVVVEGQGSIVHPAYSGVTCALLHGARADALVLCHQPTRRTVRGYDHVPLPPLAQFVQLYEDLARPVHPARVVAVALNTFDLSDADARAACERTTRETGLPAADPVRHGAEALARAVDDAVQEAAR